MRLRWDSADLAGWHRALLLGGLERKPGEDWTHTLAVPPAEPGDVWIIRQRPDDDRGGAGHPHPAWPITGYALVCPRWACSAGVHSWDHAFNCRPGARRCDGRGCWKWAGTPEDGTLTAQPSLHVLAERGGCGWHGWLRNGEMIEV